MDQAEIEKLVKTYTVASKEKNLFSQYEKKVKLFFKPSMRSFEGITFLPTQRYVTPLKTREKPLLSRVGVLSYSGTLTEEQNYILSILKQRWEQYSYGCGLVNMKTGKGKSHVIMALAEYFNCKTLVLTHNVKTLEEMVSSFERFTGFKPGTYYGKKKKVLDVTISTHDSFSKLPDELKGFDLVLYDECDTGLSKPMVNALCQSGAKLLYGFTGTPYRIDLDNNDMQLIYGKMVEYNATEPASARYNFVPRIVVAKYRTKSKPVFENFAELKDELMADEARQASQIRLVRDLLDAGRKTVLVLTERVEEAQAYYDALSPLVKCGLITGSTKTKDDEALLSMAGSGPMVIVGTVGKMARGVDVPAIDTVCLFSALHFRGTVVQSVGRALRKYEGKEDVLLLDWSDFTILPQQHYGRLKSYAAEYGVDKHNIQFLDSKSGAIRFGKPQGVQDGEGVPDVVPQVDARQRSLGV